MSVQIIAEIGINHNGSIELAKNMIDVAKVAGCDFVKFQKRTPEICIPEGQRSLIRETPWGSMTYLEYKKKLEFGPLDYCDIFAYCKRANIGCFASVWDRPSVDFMREYTDIIKVPSALIIDLDLLAYAREKARTLIISTGMSTYAEVKKAIRHGHPDVVMHANSSYPARVEELNLNFIKKLKNDFPDIQVGYSGHEYGLVCTFAAVAIGAEWVERHITLERTMWGSDQLASVEPIGIMKLVKGIRDIERALGDGNKVVYESEMHKRRSLRGVTNSNVY